MRPSHKNPRAWDKKMRPARKNPRAWDKKMRPAREKMRPSHEKMRPAFSAKQLVLLKKPPSCHPSGVSVSHPGASSARSASSATYFPLLFRAREGRPKQPACHPYLRAPLSLKLVNDTLNYLPPYKLTYVKHVRKTCIIFPKRIYIKKKLVSLQNNCKQQHCNYMY